MHCAAKITFHNRAVLEQIYSCVNSRSRTKIKNYYPIHHYDCVMYLYRIAVFSDDDVGPGTVLQGLWALESYFFSINREAKN